MVSYRPVHFIHRKNSVRNSSRPIPAGSEEDRSLKRSNHNAAWRQEGEVLHIAQLTALALRLSTPVALVLLASYPYP